MRKRTVDPRVGVRVRVQRPRSERPRTADDWQKDEEGRTRLRRPYTTTQGGKTVAVVNARHIWTAEEYDLMELLAEKGLTAKAMCAYFDPVPTGYAMANAMQNAGIPGRWERGFGKKPSKAELARWAAELEEHKRQVFQQLELDLGLPQQTLLYA